MIRSALPLCTFAAIGLAGCATHNDPPPATPVTAGSAAPASRSAYGIVESISLVTPPASAAAGGTLAPAVSGPYRVTLRMDDGSMQTMIVDSRAFLVGDRVQIMSDGRLIRS